MFKEILKIIPQLDNSQLSKMERVLNSRFGKIAKRFGKGLGAALKGGGLVGLALGLIGKILNPLKEVKDSVDRILKQGDDLVTYATQFNTTAGKLAKIQAFGEATGIDKESLVFLLSRFQTSLEEARLDPNKQTSIRQFAGRSDTADAFMDFLKGLKTLTPSQQTVVQKEIFGERQILKMSDFLQADFEDLNEKFFKGINFEQVTAQAKKIAELSDLQDGLTARRNIQEFVGKSANINSGQIFGNDARERARIALETQRIVAYKDITRISEATDRIFALVEKAIIQLSEMSTKLGFIVDAVKKILPSRIVRAIFGGE